MRPAPYHSEDCDSRLCVEVSKRHDELDGMSARERLLTVMKWRLAMLEPVIDTWATAVAIQVGQCRLNPGFGGVLKIPESAWFMRLRL